MGYMVGYSISRMILRKQVFSNISVIPNDKLTAFTVPKNNKILLINSRRQPEIKVDGKMYDVVRYKDNGTSITYYCLRDHKEEQMIKESILHNDQSGKSNPVSKTSRLILDQIIKSALLSEKMDFKSSPIKLLFFCNLCLIYPVPFLPVPAPPPQKLS
jgi:hypothetical protein